MLSATRPLAIRTRSMFRLDHNSIVNGVANPPDLDLATARLPLERYTVSFEGAAFALVRGPPNRESIMTDG